MADTTKEQLGRRIQTLRKRAKLRQEYVAEQVGIDAKSLSRIEGGTRFPSLETLDAIAQVLKTPIKDLFDFPEAPESPEVMRSFLRETTEALDEKQLQKVVSAIRTVLKEN